MAVHFLETLFLILILMIFQGGLYFLQLFDHYVCSGNNLLLLSVFQSIGIGWIYGESLESSYTKKTVKKTYRYMNVHVIFCYIHLEFLVLPC